MTQWHAEPARKSSGGINYHKNHRDKRLSSKGNNATLTRVDAEKELVHYSGRGNTQKTKSRKTPTAVVLDPKTGKSKTLAIETVVNNPANRQFARQNVLTKGAIVRVIDGSAKKTARITSRPGQNGNVQAILEKDQ